MQRKTGVEVEGLTPNQSSDDFSSDSYGDEIESELQKVFSLEDDNVESWVMTPESPIDEEMSFHLSLGILLEPIVVVHNVKRYVGNHQCEVDLGLRRQLEECEVADVWAKDGTQNGKQKKHLVATIVKFSVIWNFMQVKNSNHECYRNQEGFKSCYCYRIVPKNECIVDSCLMHEKFAASDLPEAPLVFVTPLKVSSFSISSNH
ncbi:hypothetical protein KFK09_011874 [Dendrobium nobile]|uniref:Uncharacterized protein n=1 Tax=Dendrobium nobile TaxID=94219 RepID=A0A8T3BDR3_DENNO|nr:hypothetical protein KFK09_011874 [Dendrobium nobile]